jgi:hypothetical protein
MGVHLSRGWGARLALLGLAVIGTGCGSSGGGTGGITLLGEESKAPADVLKDAQAALRGAKSVTLHLSGTSGGSKVDLTLSGDGKGNARGTGTMDGTPVELEVYSGTFYMKGNAFWAKQAPSSLTPAQKSQYLALIGDRWVSFGATGSAGSSDLAALAQPAILADCLDDHGTLSKGGTETVAGKKTVVVASKADAPGDAAQKLYVSADSPHYPVRLVQTGAPMAGTPATHGKCPAGSTGGSDTSTRDETIDLTDFDKTADISAPSNPLDLSSLGAPGG